MSNRRQINALTIRPKIDPEDRIVFGVPDSDGDIMVEMDNNIPGQKEVTTFISRDEAAKIVAHLVEYYGF